MARKRVEFQQLDSWGAVSSALAQIGQLDRQVKSAGIAMQEKIDAAKAETEKACAPLLQTKKQLEASIAAYVNAHREDLGTRKSKALHFGMVGFRKSSKIVLPRAPLKLANIVTKLRARGMTDCIVTPAESVDKDMLKKYGRADIEAVGARLDQKDSFWYEVDEEKLPI